MKEKKKKRKKKTTTLVTKPPKQKSASADEVTILAQALDGDKELVLFFLAYLKFDRNASKAYKFLHPNCTDHSCRVLGSRQLAKVSISMLLESYGLGADAYIQKIKEGMEATEISQINLRLKDDSGKTEKIIYDEIKKPNHEVQKHYHEKLGKLLGLEGKKEDGPTVAVQVNNLISEKKNAYGI